MSGLGMMLSLEQADRIRALLADGHSARAVARIARHARITIRDVERGNWHARFGRRPPPEPERERDLPEVLFFRRLIDRARSARRDAGALSIELLPRIPLELDPEAAQRLEQVRATRRRRAAEIAASGRTVDLSRWGTPEPGAATVPFYPPDGME
jgi:hypothetical protein